MGMDVMGVKPTSETGKYFRRNVWGWRPLWQYVEVMHSDLANLVPYSQSNDGDGLNRMKSEELSKRLMNDYENGVVDTYIVARNEYLSELERPECNLCEGTGIRTDKVGTDMLMPQRELEPEMAMLTGRTVGWCNGCSGEGKRDNWETSYYLEKDDIKDFAEFLADCGGFEIW